MQEIESEYETLNAELDELQQTIDETAASALEAQQAVLEGRDSLSQSACYDYKYGSASALLTLILDSSDFNEFLRNIAYLSDIMQHQSDEVAAQKERKERLDALSSSLNDQKTEQETKLQELEQKRTEANQVVADAQAQLEDAQGEEAERLAALAAAAESLAAQEEEDTSSVAVVENATTVDREDVVSADTPVISNPDPDAPGTSSDSSSTEEDSGSSSDGSSSDDSGGWLTGVASAYGGSTDSSTPNPGITATGAVCNDSSMGVAVPMSMPNYRSYFGRTVEISYGGKTVYAVVNDCGYMGGGSRVLDLQPGVWKAFGFSSCAEWGLRTVSYRFL